MYQVAEFGGEFLPVGPPPTTAELRSCSRNWSFVVERLGNFEALEYSLSYASSIAYIFHEEGVLFAWVAVEFGELMPLS